MSAATYGWQREFSTRATRGETADVPAGVYVITPQGELLGRIPIPEDLCTNLTFGGPGRKTLYVTSGKSIFKIPLAISGYSLYPSLEK